MISYFLLLQWRVCLNGRPLVNGIDNVYMISNRVKFIMNRLVMYWIELNCPVPLNTMYKIFKLF